MIIQRLSLGIWFWLQLHHADDSFLVLTTDGINFMVNSQEICNFVNQCHDPNEAAHAVIEQVT